MRVRTILSAGVFALTAVLGSAGSALADDHYGSRTGGSSSGSSWMCGQFAGAGNGEAYWGRGCAESHWNNRAPGHHVGY